MINEFSPNASQVVRHESIHLHQQRFMQEALGRPTEEFVRGRVSRLKWIPRWLELGVVAPMLDGGEYLASGEKGLLRRAAQAEAESLEHR